MNEDRLVIIIKNLIDIYEHLSGAEGKDVFELVDFILSGNVLRRIPKECSYSEWCRAYHLQVRHKEYFTEDD